jgi:hypothetical protein
MDLSNSTGFLLDITTQMSLRNACSIGSMWGIAPNPAGSVFARPKPYLKILAPHKIVQHLADEINRVLECDKRVFAPRRDHAFVPNTDNLHCTAVLRGRGRFEWLANEWLAKPNRNGQRSAVFPKQRKCPLGGDRPRFHGLRMFLWHSFAFYESKPFHKGYFAQHRYTGPVFAKVSINPPRS